MVEVKLVGLLDEGESYREIDNGEGWVEWRALQLIDERAQVPIAEWFYVAACNQYYFDKLPRDSKNGYFVQDVFDAGQLLSSVQKVFEKLTFDSWDDFYDQMSKHFMYEDD